MIEKIIMLAKVEGNRRRGRQQIKWLGRIKEITGMSLKELGLLQETGCLGKNFSM